MQLILTKTGVLSPGATEQWRVCPWDQTNTHVPPGSRIELRAQVRTHGIGTVHTTLHDANESSPAPFNPGDPMQPLDRDVPASILLVDEEPVDMSAATLVWQELGTVGEHRSPAVTISQDTTNRRVLVVSVANLEMIDLPYTVEFYVKVL